MDNNFGKKFIAREKRLPKLKNKKVAVNTNWASIGKRQNLGAGKWNSEYRIGSNIAHPKPANMYVLKILSSHCVIKVCSFSTFW